MAKNEFWCLKKYEKKAFSLLKAFDFIFTLTKNYGKGSVYLTVNKHNEHSIDVYKHKGFEITDSVVTDIGNGYVMDDFIFQKNL